MHICSPNEFDLYENLSRFNVVLSDSDWLIRIDSWKCLSVYYYFYCYYYCWQHNAYIWNESQRLRRKQRQSWTSNKWVGLTITHFTFATWQVLLTFLTLCKKTLLTVACLCLHDITRVRTAWHYGSQHAWGSFHVEHLDNRPSKICRKTWTFKCESYYSLITELYLLEQVL